MGCSLIKMGFNFVYNDQQFVYNDEYIQFRPSLSNDIYCEFDN